MRIFKYPLNWMIRQQTIPILKEDTILTVQVQNGTPCVWVKTESYEYPEHNHSRKIYIIPTGEELTLQESKAVYIGTFQIVADIDLVFHVFEGL